MPVALPSHRLAVFSSVTRGQVHFRHGSPHGIAIAISGVLVLLLGVLVCGIILDAVSALCQAALSVFHNPKSSQFSQSHVPKHRPRTIATGAAVLSRHVDIDALCPITAHTPAELPPRHTGRTVLPENPGSPCALCSGFCGLELIKHGHLKRTLPCSHEFHAICVDKYFMAESESGTCVHDFYCPTCATPVVASAKDGAEMHRPAECSTFVL
jgi:hypothetical protein